MDDVAVPDADISGALDVLSRVYTDAPSSIAHDLRKESQIKQLYYLLHEARVLPGWFEGDPVVVSTTPIVENDEISGFPVVQGVTHHVRVNFLYERGPYRGVRISAEASKGSKDAAIRAAYTMLLIQIARSVVGIRTLADDRFEQLLHHYVPGRHGVTVLPAHFEAGAQLPVDRESHSVDFKSYVASAEVVRQIIGFLNGREGTGLLICGVRDSTWVVTGVLDRYNQPTNVNMERLVNELDVAFHKCNPPLQAGREYAAHKRDLATADGSSSGSSIVVVEAHRPASVKLLYKGAANECFVRREAQTMTLTGAGVYTVERDGHRDAWTRYWQS